MTNVMIVDDEVLVRTGLRTLVKWEENGFHLCAEASNGEEAMKYLKHGKVDIVLTDIRMPGMDGLALMRQIREQGIPCEVMVLSSYDDFQYVKQAMVLGARDYIHKPTMVAEEIVESLKRVDAERRLRGGPQETGDASPKTRRQQGCRLLRRHIRVLWSGAEQEAEDRQMLSALRLTEKSYHILLLRVLSTERYPKGGGPTGRVKEEIERLWELSQKDVGGYACICHEGEYWILAGEEEPPARLKDEIAGIFGNNGQPDVVIKESDGKVKWELLSEEMRRLTAEADREGEFQIWLGKLSTIVAQAVTIIHRRFDQNLTLDDIAREIHVNASYLSRAFQKETGKNFVAYLTELRIAYGKELLLTTDLTIREIVERVGYNNDKYYMKLFKKYTGMTPGEFRNRR